MTDQIRAAGDHLLDVLAAEKSVNYSRFYNDAPETEEALVRGVMRHLTAQAAKDGEEVEDWVEDDVRNEGHLHIEWAAWQLVSRGVVAIEPLEGTKLIDD